MHSLLLLCLTGSVAAQTVPFRSEVRTVLIPVSVTDESGKYVEGLKAGDFRVLDDGAPRPVSLDVFGLGAAPISLVIAIQTSKVPNPVAGKIQRVGSLIQPLVIGHRGEAAIVTFDYSIQWPLEFTKDSASIQRAIASLQPGEYKQARLFDAVLAAAARLRDRPARRVLLIFSQAQDKGSKAKLDEVMEVLARDGVEVFAASLSAPVAPDDIEALTHATGGVQYRFGKGQAAEKAIEEAGAEVHRQYILSFAQGAAHPGLHRIEVSVPFHPTAGIRSRRAWWAE